MAEFRFSRREFLWAGAAAVSWKLGDGPLISKEDLDYLKHLAKRTIASATKDASRPGLGFACITPGGDYPSLWIRDFSMATGCGLIPFESVLLHLKAIAKTQNGPKARVLAYRALIPPYAIPDHINYQGGAVFYPGTYSSGDDQGGEPYGKLPPMDDHFEFINIAYQCWKHDHDCLGIEVDGKTLLDRLILALDVPLSDDRTGHLKTSEGNRAVGFGFCDGIYLTGTLLFPTLLKIRALDQMVQMTRGTRYRGMATNWSKLRQTMIDSIPETFGFKGWLKAATGVGQQPDVWGTLFALHLGVIKGDLKKTVLSTVKEAVRMGTITYRGAVRHIPTDCDFSKNSAWERTAGEALNHYQNGAYWHVPTGWLATALSQIDRSLARAVVADMVEHFREEEFKGAPWECLHPDGDYRQNPVYMASVTLPLECLLQRG